MRKEKAGFSLIELLVVIAVIAILAALLFPIVSRATVRAKVARVHCELEQIGNAIQMYRDDWAGKPPLARTYCTGSAMKIADYNELPPELYKKYLSTGCFYDPFNPGHSYKYIAPGPGYSNGTKTVLAIWVPEDYPASTKDCVPYYEPAEAPLKWAIWSVGPSRGVDIFTSEKRMLPVPRKWWYPYSDEGVIVRLSDGRGSP